MIFFALLVLLPSLGLNLKDSISVEVHAKNMQVLSTSISIPANPSDWNRLPDSSFHDLPQKVRLEFGQYGPPALLRMIVQSPHPGRWWLVSTLRTPGLLGVKLGTRFLGYFGSALPFRKQPVAVHNLSIPLDVDQGIDTLYIQASEPQGPCALRLHITPDRLFPMEVERSSILDSLAIGYFLAILVIALFLWGAVQERAFGWYAAYLALAVLWVLVKRGLAFAYLWPDHPYWNPMASVSLSFLAVGCFALFIRNILSLAKRQPWLSRTISVIVTAQFLFGVVTLFPLLTAIPEIRLAAKICMGSLLCLLLGAVVFRTWRRDLFARQILFALLPLFFAMAFGLLVEFGFTAQGPAIKTNVMIFAAMLENTLTTLILVREVYRRERERVHMEKNFHREVVERSDKHLNWIAQELHDNLGQQVSSLRMWMFSLRSDLPENVMEDLDGRFDSLSRGIRNLSHELHPSVLNDRGVETALREFFQDLNNLTTLDIRFRCEGILPNFTNSVSTHIYRIVQEAVANAMRHAAPKMIEISLRAKGNLVQMDIVDDGKGFDPDYATHKNGIGLAGIRSRVETIGGRLDIESHMGKGTRLRIEIAWKA